MKKIAAIIAYLSSLGISSGQYEPNTVPAKIDEFVAPFAKAGHFSGVILAARDGKVVYEKAFGWASVELRVPNRTDTRIGIASITKPMTSVILIHLVEENKVALSDKASKYLPGFPNGDKVTIEMLSKHRSGIPHRVMRPEEEAVPHTSEEMADRIAHAKLEFEPDTRELYSSAGYTLLARILEIASKKTYSQLLQEYVFTPAGMHETSDFNSESAMDRRAQEYLLDATGTINAPLKDYSFLIGAGSVFSTAEDLYRFGDAIVNGKLGLTAKTNLMKNDVLSASGSTNGHRATMKLNVGRNYGYVLMSNLASGAFDVISKNLEAILESREAEPPVVPHPSIVRIEGRALADYAGQYQREGESDTFQVTLKNNSIYAGDIKLQAIGRDCFFEYKYYGNVCFVRDEMGRIETMTWTGSGFKLVWKRQ